MIYRPKRHVDHKQGGRRSFTWTDYRDLLIAVHQQLSAPIVVVWDNLNVHSDRRLREFINTHDRITCHFLPAYAPDLNPVEGIWSLLRRSSQANTAFTDPDHLMSVLRHGLRKIQHRSNLIAGCLAETGLILTTSRQQRQKSAGLFPHLTAQGFLDPLVKPVLAPQREVVEHRPTTPGIMRKKAPLIARPVLVEDRVHDLPQITGAGGGGCRPRHPLLLPRRDHRLDQRPLLIR